MAKLNSWNHPAPHGSRFLAQLIDIAIIQILSSGIFYITNLEKAWSGTVLAFTFIGYFVYFQSRYGWTPGKKIFGLELIEVESGERPSLMIILKRETVGRLLVILTFLFGYLMIFFLTNRQGLHDKFAKTRVISPYSADKERFSILKILAGLIGATTLGVAVLVYFVFFSVEPIKLYAEVLGKSGVSIGDVSGNLYQGFTFKRVTYSGSTLDLGIESLFVRLSNILDFILKNEFRIREYKAKGIQVNLKGEAADNLFEFLWSIKAPPLTAGADSLKSIKMKMRFSVFVDNFELNDIELSDHGKAFLKVDKLISRQMGNVQGKKMFFEALRVESQSFSLDLGRSSLAGGLFSFDASKIKIKKELQPKLLVNSIEFEGMGSLDLKERIFSGQLRGFRDSIFLTSGLGRIELRGKKFHPHWYFRKFPPTHSFDFQSSGASISDLAEKKVRGTFALGKSLCHFEPGRHSSPKSAARCVLGPHTIWVNFISQKAEPYMTLALMSGNFKTLGEVIATFGIPEKDRYLFTFERP